MNIGTLEYSRRIQQHQQTLYRIAYCYVKNEQEALDIVGDAVYKGLVKLKKLNDPNALEAWMDRIVVNTALDYLHSKKRKLTYLQQDISEIPADESSLDWNEQIDLYGALDCLEPEEKTFIILRFFEGLSFREIAQIVEKPESAVKARVYRILKKLRQQLSE